MSAQPLHRLTHLAALGDAAAAAEVIRWRERQGEAWCVPPYGLPQPKLTDPLEVRDPAMRAWVWRYAQAHGAARVDVWRALSTREGVHYGAAVSIGGAGHIVSALLTDDGPRILGRDGDAPPPTHCLHSAQIWLGACINPYLVAWRSTCTINGFSPLSYWSNQGSCLASTFAPCAT